MTRREVGLEVSGLRLSYGSNGEKGSGKSTKRKGKRMLGLYALCIGGAEWCHCYRCSESEMLEVLWKDDRTEILDRTP